MRVTPTSRAERLAARRATDILLYRQFGAVPRTFLGNLFRFRPIIRELVLWSGFAIATLPLQMLCQQSSDVPKIPLRMGLYVSPDVRHYDPSFNIAGWQHLRVGFWLASEVEDLSNRAFPSLRVFQRSPFGLDLQNLDYVLVLEAIHAEVDTGLRTSVVDVDDTFAVYTTTGKRVYGSTEKKTQKVRTCCDRRKIQEALNESLGLTVKEFLTKFANADVAVNPPPPSVKVPVPNMGVLVLSTEPYGAQVYLDDQFKGSTSEHEGKLVLGNLAGGTYALRVSQAGHNDWEQSITLNPREELKLQVKLVPAAPTALTLKEVEEALRNGVPKTRVASLVERYGVNFILTDEAEQHLRAAGADSELLLVISKNKK